MMVNDEFFVLVSVRFIVSNETCNNSNNNNNNNNNNNKTGIEFITELGNHLNLATGDKLEMTYLFQRLSIAIQRGNELCFNGTFVPR